MMEHPRCLFGLDDERRNVPRDLRGPLCERPAWGYRFHLGESGNMDRLTLYCGTHDYGNCQGTTPAILKRARAEGWPFMEWPPPNPPKRTAFEEALVKGFLGPFGGGASTQATKENA